jgi:hypothetical protein
MAIWLLELTVRDSERTVSARGSFRDSSTCFAELLMATFQCHPDAFGRIASVLAFDYFFQWFFHIVGRCL